MTGDEIKPGSDGRPPGCFYFKDDHERAAEHIRKNAPEVFDWIKAHPEGLPKDLSKHQLLWRTAAEILPKASLIDHAEVVLILRLQAHPLTEDEKQKIEALRLRSEEWRRKRLH